MKANNTLQLSSSGSVCAAGLEISLVCSCDWNLDGRRIVVRFAQGGHVVDEQTPVEALWCSSAPQAKCSCVLSTVAWVHV